MVQAAGSLDSRARNRDDLRGVNPGCPSARLFSRQWLAPCPQLSPIRGRTPGLAFSLGPGGWLVSCTLPETNPELLGEQDGGGSVGRGSHGRSPAGRWDCDLEVLVCPRPGLKLFGVTVRPWSQSIRATRSLPLPAHQPCAQNRVGLQNDVHDFVRL